MTRYSLGYVASSEHHMEAHYTEHPLENLNLGPSSNIPSCLVNLAHKVAITAVDWELLECHTVVILG